MAKQITTLFYRNEQHSASIKNTPVIEGFFYKSYKVGIKFNVIPAPRAGLALATLMLGRHHLLALGSKMREGILASTPS